jgi:peptidoglycan/xylan/chitin deacetylase (PgdA/CDA1 family)
MDDMYRNTSDPSIRWDNFINMAAWAAGNSIVMSSGTVVSNNTLAGAFDDMSAEMVSNPLHIIANHSYSHPDLYLGTEAESELQYKTSKEMIEANVTYPERFTYKGNPYLNVMWQWGGWVGFPYDDEAYEDLKPVLSDAGYLIIRNPQGIKTDGYTLVWDEDNGMFNHTTPISTVGRVISGDFTDDFDDAYNNKGWYSFYAHPWLESDYYDANPPVNNAAWETWKTYIGGKDDVWYTDPNSFFQYKYYREAHPPVINFSMVGDDFVLTFQANSVARDKHGLSVPVTYAIQKPSGWGSNDVEVYYKDADVDWTLMTEKLSTDIFTGINAFRNDGTQVLASQGFPTESDYFELKLVEVP